MSEPPRVSVCLITYRHELYIEQAVRSVLAQETSFPVEIVIGEDASPDRTRAVLERLDREFPGRLTLLLREGNLGMHRNASDTYAHCLGEFVAMLEGDDYWTDPHKLQRQVEALDQHPEWSGCFHPAEYVNPNGQPLGRRHPTAHREPVTFDDLCRTNWVQTCSLVVRKSAIPEIPDWLQQLAIADWAICLIAATSGPLGMLPETMSCYRVHPGGVWTSQTDLTRTEGILRAYGLIAQNLPQRERETLLRAGSDYAVGVCRSLQHRIEEIEESESYRLAMAIVRLTSPLRRLFRKASRN